MPYTIPNAADAAFAAQARPDKVDIDILVAGMKGWGVVGTGCAVTAQGTPNMTVAVNSGTVRINAADVDVTSGNVTITTADATNPRIDLVVVDNTGAKSATAGTAAAAPVCPAIPSNSIVLAMVYVPAGATTITSTRVTDKRVNLPSFVSYSTTAFNLPTASSVNTGMLGVYTDVNGGTLYRSDGASWNAVAPGAVLSTNTAGGALTRGLLNAKGDLIVASADDTPVLLAVGTPGQILLPDSGATPGLKWIADPQAGSITGAIAETLPARVGGSATVAAGSSGQLRMQTIWLPARVVITSITFVSGSTALTSGTHGWAALYDSSLNLLRQSTDDTSITWTNAATHTFTLSSTYTITTAGWYYIGLMVASTGNMPTLTGAAGSGTLNGLALISSGTSTGSLTGTAPNPAAALTAVGGIPYAYVS